MTEAEKIQALVRYRLEQAIEALAAAGLIGKTFGPYQLLGKLGEGGMGEVYRARETRPPRDS